MIRYYFDVHVPEAIAIQLRRRGVDVLRAQEDNALRLDDAVVLERAVGMGRVVVSQDRDYEGLAWEWMNAGRSFPGIIFAPQDTNATGRYVNDLEIIAKVSRPDELADKLTRLPLRSL